MTGAAAILQPRGKCRRMKGKTPNSTEKEDRKNLQLWRYRWGANQTNSTNQSPLHLLHEELYPNLSHYWASLIAQLVKNPPAMQEIPVQFLGWEEGLGYPLQYSWTFLVAQLVKDAPAMRETWIGKIPWRTERLPSQVFWPGKFHGLYSPWGPKELDTTEQLALFHYQRQERKAYSQEKEKLTETMREVS